MDSFSKEELQEIADKSINYYDMARNLGKVNVTKLFKSQLVMRCDENNINCSHFIGEDYKKCTVCEKIKSISDFYVVNKKIMGFCKECHKEKSRNKHRQIKEEDYNFKRTLKCKKCGESRYYLLDFHHRNPTEKDFCLSDKTRTNLENFKEELEKCDVLCGNCHREWHFIERHSYKFYPITYDEWLQDSNNIKELTLN